MAGRLQEKVAIVTGAAHGIGRAIAERYGAEGATVVVSDINEAGAEAVAQGITDAGGTALAIATDVSDKAAVDRLFDQTLEQFGTVDVIVNSAGLVKTERHFLEGDEAWWDAIHAVNLKGTFLCGLRAAQHMARKGSGVIINVSSGGATRAHRGNAAYDATKGGIEALTRAMAVDLAPYGVRVNGLIPGSINTSGMSPEVKQERGKAIPMGRVGEPEDMTGAAVFLASDDAAYVNGQLIAVDGGILAAMRSPAADIFPPSRYPMLER
ncbi:MAG: short-chain dehydrogenase [Thermomicrobiales bacterium]|jgi:NAD(P)-dependent dehydrogenase (short-subunit alcohol dehydrogenase family)|nr:short-chain dehydrogenase [Thermomicrobiales bacterium]